MNKVFIILLSNFDSSMPLINYKKGMEYTTFYLSRTYLLHKVYFNPKLRIVCLKYSPEGYNYFILYIFCCLRPEPQLSHPDSIKQQGCRIIF